MKTSNTIAINEALKRLNEDPWSFASLPDEMKSHQQVINKACALQPMNLFMVEPGRITTELALTSCAKETDLAIHVPDAIIRSHPRLVVQAGRHVFDGIENDELTNMLEAWLLLLHLDEGTLEHVTCEDCKQALEKIPSSYHGLPAYQKCYLMLC